MTDIEKIHREFRRIIEKNNLVIVTTSQPSRPYSGANPIRKSNGEPDVVFIDYINLIKQ
jgi:hypothetical protein